MSSECPWCSLRIVSTLPVNAGIIKCSLPPKQWGIAMLVQECTRNAEQLRCLAIWKPGNILLKMAHSKAAQAQNKWKVQAGIIPPRYSRRAISRSTTPDLQLCFSLLQGPARQHEESGGSDGIQAQDLCPHCSKARTSTLLQVTSLHFKTVLCNRAFCHDRKNPGLHCAIW